MSNPSCFARSLVLTGPTGSGKSALALEFAERLHAEIVALDSMTLYRGFDIGTAKPSATDRSRVPHHLIDVLDPSESGSVAWWLNQAAAAVADIEGRGRTALFVGGTPMYLKALLRGLFPGPSANDELRKRLESEAARVGAPALHARLARMDPLAADRIHPNDLRRIVRALEVRQATGRPISELQTEWAIPGQVADVVCLELPRSELYARIDRRVEVMLESGWLDEARRLRDLAQPPSREAAAALGYRELWAHLEGRISWADTIKGIQQRSRNYAKRQLTWFRSLPECHFATAELTRDRWRSKMNESDAMHRPRRRNENCDTASS
jgi:tRNA dimethylallyltransferase